jgi:Cd2+/Zn2+-exporting ATPase
MTTNRDKPPLAFRIHGLDCAEEIATLRRELGPVVGGVDRLSFDILNGKLLVDCSAADVSADQIIRAVAATGMHADLWHEGDPLEGDTRSWERFGQTALTTVAGLLGVAGLLVHTWAVGGLSVVLGVAESTRSGGAAMNVAVALYIAALLAAFWHVWPKAWRAVVRMRPDMNLLMTIAVVGAAALGEWVEAVTVALLFSVSLLLESWSVGRARRAIAALLDLAPITARLRGSDGTLREVPAEEVAVGSLLVVRPGEKIPLDGTVQRGVSDVNQAAITGESVPVPKGVRDEIFAGTINGDGTLEIESTRPANDTTLARITRMVGEAHSRRAPSEQWVEQFARVYTPLVMLLAALVMVVPPVLTEASWYDWIYRALVLLVIACPCALVISTPVSIVAALATAARHGVLVKGGVYIEAPARLAAIAMDKTGTLTEGRPAVVDVVPLSGHNEAELLERAAALEANSNHPLAQAIVAAATQRGVTFEPAEDFEINQGKGATGRIDGKLFWLGSHRLLEERGQATSEIHDQLAAMSQAGRTVVVVGHDAHVCGFISLADALRPGIATILQQIRQSGIRKVVMLTGDNEGTAQAIAREAGVDEVHAELLPEDKVRAVEDLVEHYTHVAMVGDGVNDAPAMARASLGIAMGAAGSDAAIETADIALMSDDLAKIPWLVRHSRRTLTIIRQNITFALAVKALFVILTCAGFASLWAAIAADMGASLLVIFNGLRLLGTNEST